MKKGFLGIAGMGLFLWGIHWLWSPDKSDIDERIERQPPEKIVSAMEASNGFLFWIAAPAEIPLYKSAAQEEATPGFSVTIAIDNDSFEERSLPVEEIECLVLVSTAAGDFSRSLLLTLKTTETLDPGERLTWIGEVPLFQAPDSNYQGDWSIDVAFPAPDPKYLGEWQIQVQFSCLRSILKTMTQIVMHPS